MFEQEKSTNKQIARPINGTTNRPIALQQVIYGKYDTIECSPIYYNKQPKPPQNLSYFYFRPLLSTIRKSSKLVVDVGVVDDAHPVSQRVTSHTWTKSSYGGFNSQESWCHRGQNPYNPCMEYLPTKLPLKIQPFM